ncbi:OsmC family protein [Bacillus sp. BRMEA1]|uniref:OsmC family protein n=1 Tax=Neobacillus endophyticus TaxID=2738405 RepID=UPI00156496C6|nr:OsmC family protein [Neobacillus endophyticus]NRD79443.1 OsmC family protein [Neobacillus endophyticus]
MTRSHFIINGSWQGNREGVGMIRLPGGENLEVSVPKELDGPGVGANPEELLISSANNCYMITLSSMLSNRKIEVEKLEVVSEGIVEKIDGKLHFKQIIHKANLSIRGTSGVTVEKLEEIVFRAEKACFIGNILRNSIDLSVIPIVELI